MFKEVLVFGVLLAALIAESSGRQTPIDWPSTEGPTDEINPLNSQEDLDRISNTTRAQSLSLQDKIDSTTDSAQPGNQEDLDLNGRTTEDEQPPFSWEEIDSDSTTDSAKPEDLDWISRTISEINQEDSYSTTENPLYKIKKPIHIKDVEDVKTKLQEADEKLVLLFFVAKWCGHSRYMDPIVNEIVTMLPEKVIVYKVDVDDQAHVSSQYAIQSMPTFVFVRNNTKLIEFSGADEDYLHSILRNYIQNKV